MRPGRAADGTMTAVSALVAVHSAPKASDDTSRAVLLAVPSSASPLPRSASGTAPLPSAISTPSVAA